MLAQTSVHMDCTVSTPNGDSTESYDIGVASGHLATTASNFSTTEIEVGGVAYFSTNNTQVLTVQGVPEAEAEKLTGGWISFRPGDSYGNLYLNYTTVSHGLTLASQATGLRLAGSLKRTAATWAQGVAVYGVSGGASPEYSIFSNDVKGSTETVYIAASGAPLPVRVWGHSSSGAVTTCDFGNWGEPLTIAAPPEAVPVTSIPAG